MKRTRLIIALLGLLAAIAVIAFVIIRSVVFQPTVSHIPSGLSPEQLEASERAFREEFPDTERPPIEIVAEGLDTPWEIEMLPDDRLIVTERSGRIVILGDERVVIPVEGVEEYGEGGLLGLALHPDFAENRLLYLYLTTREGGDLRNQVARYALVDDRLEKKTVILDDIPASRYHNGGRLLFEDGVLLVTTGDAGDGSQAQDVNSLAGKVLAMDEDGNPLPGAPFGNLVFTYGHRNPQGISHGFGSIWVTEHGPSGLSSGHDEINELEPGGNYGWPDSVGERVAPGTIGPVIESGADETWAPADMAYDRVSEEFYFTGLRGESLYQSRDPLIAHFRGEYGRLRALFLAPDGAIYVGTSNQDGRGRPRDGDDKIIRIDPRILSM